MNAKSKPALEPAPTSAEEFKLEGAVFETPIQNRTLYRAAFGGEKP
ncbi:MAG: hypothetical protein K6T57_00675 [Thermaceae bacterium]|nr:hypothetical protein [Meiothermus granaticius]MCL6525369.1 hypothetical protein [Thermaceae bacterium]